MAATNAGRRAAEIGWEPEYAPDKGAMLAALKLAASSGAAILEAEAHIRECPICRTERPEDACPEGTRLEVRAGRR